MSAGAAASGGGAGKKEGRNDGPMKCTWHVGTSEPSPHTMMRPERAKVMDTVLEAIGNTPMVRLNKIAAKAGLKCNLLAKCEFFNAGGSVKDRIGHRMLVEAEREGKIKPGDTLIEPTSGNTGIGIALAGAVKGYKVILTMPEKMSGEKIAVLRALNAQVVRTPTEAAWDAPESHIGVAKRLNKEIPNSFILDQYSNPGNPLAHYDGTAEEILEQCDGKVDMVVVGAGTGGTITGIARKLKEKCPDVIVVGVDPEGSILAEPDALNDKGRGVPNLVEGTGYDFIPTTLDRDIVDKWIKTNDRDSFVMARRLIREEGLLCGGSSGGSVFAALEAARDLGPGKNVVVVLPDSIRNYLTKFVDDSWCHDHGITDADEGIGLPTRPAGPDSWWHDKIVADLRPAKPVSIAPDLSCQDAIDLLAGEGFDVLPVINESGHVLGVVTEGNLTAKLTAGRIKAKDSVSDALFRQFRRVSADTSLAELSYIFDKDHYALVVSSSRVVTKAGPVESTVVTGVVTRIDLLKYVTHNAPETPVAKTSE